MVKLEKAQSMSRLKGRLNQLEKLFLRLMIRL
jgi:hypothetical protein